MEISRKDHDKYVSGYNDDLSTEPAFPARLANSIPGYDETLGIVVAVKFGTKGQRPSYLLDKSLPHQLATDQHEGITSARQHAMLEAVGHFRRQNAA